VQAPLDDNASAAHAIKTDLFTRFRQGNFIVGFLVPREN
jgi:hypothetical protein